MFRPSALAECLTSTMKRPYEMPLLTFHWYIHVSVLINLPETDKRNMRIRLKTTQKHFSCSFVWVSNLISYSQANARTWAQGVRKKKALKRMPGRKKLCCMRDGLVVRSRDSRNIIHGNYIRK